MIRLEDVSFRYRAAKDPALRDVSCHIRRGELVGLLGRSGAGRSTLASTLNGTIPHLVRGDLTGRVLIDGQDIRTQRPRDLADRIGFVFQDFEAQLFSTNVSLEVAFGPENLGVHPAEIARRVDSCLGVVRLSHLSHKAPAALSGGQKQRLALASVLALEPTVLILDEPTSDLDPAGRRELLEAIRSIRRTRDLTLVMIDPETDEMGWADRLIVLDQGRVAMDGTPAALWDRADEMDALGVKGFTLAKLARRLGVSERWVDADAAANAIRTAGWGGAPGVAARLRLADAAHAGGEVLLEVDGVAHRYPDGTEALARRPLRHPSRRVRGHPGPERQREDHAGQASERYPDSERGRHPAAREEPAGPTRHRTQPSRRSGLSEPGPPDLRRADLGRGRLRAPPPGSRRGGGGGARRGGAGGGGARGHGRSGPLHPDQGDAAAHRRGQHAGHQTRGDHPGRAHHRPRPSRSSRG